jgi:hypothetical protein
MSARDKKCPRSSGNLKTRPCTRGAIVGLAAHVFFELGAGVGLPAASVLGPLPAATLWAGSTVAALRGAARAPVSGDTGFAIGNAAALTVVLGHLTGWPRRSTVLGLPWLTDCEGLGRELMPAYNAILYSSGAAALAALLAENRCARRPVTLLPLLFVPIVVRAQRAEHRRLLRNARQRPRWWNRRLRAGSAAPSS